MQSSVWVSLSSKPTALNKAEVIWLSLHNFYTKLRLHLLFLKVSLQCILESQLGTTLWSKRRTEAKTPSASSLDQALGIEGWGGRGGGGEASHTLRLVDLSASEHKDSSVLGLEVSVSYLVSPTHDALESRFTYPHLPVPLLRPSTSIWFSLLGWIWEKLLFSLRPPPAETKAKRQSSLYRRHTNTTEENPPIWGKAHRNTHTNKIKQVRA